ncbi:MAG: 7-cyano-7-deazaguanine synthase QueC [Methanomicrobiales archaeon]|nr:7-cyano-7-deazaguanine synthase QueC [Methanomicrobiales archaeon]
MMDERLAVCLISGGMDSTTAAYLAKRQGFGIIGLHINYGQRTEERERRCARTIAELLGAREFMEVDIGYLLQIGRSSLTDRSIEVEDYDPSDEDLPTTYVPFRNANLLSIATSLAEARGAEAIFIGAQAQDYSGYPDCRREFMEAFQRAIDLGTSPRTHIRLIAPFLEMNKTEILRLGLSMGVPYGQTWSCYRGGDLACGRCGSCHFRRSAFRELGIEDPLRYEDEGHD